MPFISLLKSLLSLSRIKKNKLLQQNIQEITGILCEKKKSNEKWVKNMKFTKNIYKMWMAHVLYPADVISRFVQFQNSRALSRTKNYLCSRQDLGLQSSLAARIRSKVASLLSPMYCLLSVLNLSNFST